LKQRGIAEAMSTDPLDVEHRHGATILRRIGIGKFRDRFSVARNGAADRQRGLLRLSAKPAFAQMRKRLRRKTAALNQFAAIFASAAQGQGKKSPPLHGASSRRCQLSPGERREMKAPSRVKPTTMPTTIKNQRNMFLSIRHGTTRSSGVRPAGEK